jgi:hypothetical protein
VEVCLHICIRDFTAEERERERKKRERVVIKSTVFASKIEQRRQKLTV